MAKVKVNWIGEEGLEEYNGFDGDIPLNIPAGETVTVSAEKAEQLAADFGHLCVVDGKGPTKKNAAAAAADEEPEKVKDIVARVDEASDEELVELAENDERAGVQKAVTAEMKRRLDERLAEASDEELQDAVDETEDDAVREAVEAEIARRAEGGS